MKRLAAVGAFFIAQAAWGKPPAAAHTAAMGPVELQTPAADSLPEEARNFFSQALSEFGKGDLPAAKRDLGKVLEIAPEDISTRLDLALIGYREGKIDEAVQQLKAAVRLKPECGPGWFLLGVIFCEHERLDEAVASLSQAALLQPKDPRVHLFFGVTLGKKGWFFGAEDELRKAIELKPDYAEAHFNLAVFYLQRNPPAIELARRHYQAALDLGAAPDSQIAKSIAREK